MSKLNSTEIIKVLTQLVGSVHSSGDSFEDRERNENLGVLIDVVNWALDTVEDSAMSRHALDYYKRDIGERAYSAMCEWKDWLVEHVEKIP